MKVLELFAGSRSIGKVAEQLNYDVTSLDVKPFEDIDIVIDILDFDTDEYFDIVWASPPCTSYSIAGIRHHRRGVLPISDFAEKSDRIMLHVKYLIDKIQPKYWYIENPRGMLRKMPFMKDMERTTVWYCKYGDAAAKPTDIWTNNLYSIFNPEGWKPAPQCYNGNVNCHHETSPRGSKNGTQKKANNYLRSIIPSMLCLEILTAIHNN